MDRAQHVPVLAGRVTALLAPALVAEGAVLVDATLGRAGHARALLEACPGMFLIGIDADVAAIEAAGEYRHVLSPVHAPSPFHGDVLAVLVFFCARPAPSVPAAGWHRGSDASRERRMGAGARGYRIPGSTSSAASANESSCVAR